MVLCLFAMMIMVVSGSSATVSFSSVTAFTLTNRHHNKCNEKRNRLTVAQPHSSPPSSYFHLDRSWVSDGCGCCLRTSIMESSTWALRKSSNDDNDSTSGDPSALPADHKNDEAEEAPTFFGLEPKSEPPPTLFGLEPNSSGGLYDDDPLGGGLLFTGPLILIASIYMMIEIFFGDYDDITSSLPPPDYLPPPPGL